MVETLEMLKTPQLQKKAFTIAMDNSLFRSLVEKYNSPPHDTQPVMAETTLAARRKRTSRKKQSAVDTITSSISSLSTQEEKNAVMKNVVENTDAGSAVLASGYIKNNKKVEAALNTLEQRNKLIAHATASGKMVE